MKTVSFGRAKLTDAFWKPLWFYSNTRDRGRQLIIYWFHRKLKILF